MVLFRKSKRADRFHLDTKHRPEFPGWRLQRRRMQIIDFGSRSTKISRKPSNAIQLAEWPDPVTVLQRFAQFGSLGTQFSICASQAVSQRNETKVLRTSTDWAQVCKSLHHILWFRPSSSKS
jgi:hypothetical protein